MVEQYLSYKESRVNCVEQSANKSKKVYMAGISITKLLIIGALIVLLFGTNKLRTLGSDLGAAIKGFKKAMDSDTPPSDAHSETPALQVENKK